MKYATILLGIFNNTLSNHFTTGANDIFSEAPDPVLSPPDPTGTDDMDKEHSSTEVSSKPQKSDVVPCEQYLVQCTEGMYLSTMNLITLTVLITFMLQFCEGFPIIHLEINLQQQEMLYFQSPLIQ